MDAIMQTHHTSREGLGVALGGERQAKPKPKSRESFRLSGWPQLWFAASHVLLFKSKQESVLPQHGRYRVPFCWPIRFPIPIIIESGIPFPKVLRFMARSCYVWMNRQHSTNLVWAASLQPSSRGDDRWNGAATSLIKLKRTNSMGKIKKDRKMLFGIVLCIERECSGRHHLLLLYFVVGIK